MKFRTLLVVIVAGCVRPSVNEGPTLAPETLEPRATNAPVFGSLVTRYGTITIKLGDQGPLYTVVTKEGETRVEDADEVYLAEYLPEIHEFVEGTLAGGDIIGGLDR